MNRIKKIVAVVAVAITVGVGLSACDQTEADTTSYNLSQDAEQFKITRDIVFYNSVTDKYMFEITGLCSVDKQTELYHALAVTCKIGKDKYVKEFLGQSDNVAWFSTQVEATAADPYHYTVIFKPETIIPNIQLDTSAGK